MELHMLLPAVTVVVVADRHQEATVAVVGQECMLQVEIVAAAQGVPLPSLHRLHRRGCKRMPALGVALALRRFLQMTWQLLAEQNEINESNPICVYQSLSLLFYALQ